MSSRGRSKSLSVSKKRSKSKSRSRSRSKKRAESPTWITHGMWDNLLKHAHRVKKSRSRSRSRSRSGSRSKKHGSKKGSNKLFPQSVRDNLQESARYFYSAAQWDSTDEDYDDEDIEGEAARLRQYRSIRADAVDYAVKKLASAGITKVPKPSFINGHMYPPASFNFIEGVPGDWLNEFVSLISDKLKKKKASTSRSNKKSRSVSQKSKSK